MEADALVIAGDTCGHDLVDLRKALSLFESFPGRRMLVAGNHCLWVRDGQSSLHRYACEIRDVARECGFDYLDDGPVVLGNVAFVGNVGWYDYAFACPKLGLPRRFYERKVGPGAAAMMAEHHDLFDEIDDLREDHYDVGARWMDGVYVKLGTTDEQFAVQLADKLRRHIHDVRDRVHEIVVVLHHLPFEELVVRTGRPNWDFAGAFMGSPIFGEVLLTEPKVRHCVCGHTHTGARIRQDNLTCVTVGSTYVEKRYEILDIGNGICP